MHAVGICIGCVPLNEPFARVGATPDWLWLQGLEAETYRAALIARFGLPPEGFELAIRHHDAAASVGSSIEARFDADNAGYLAYYEHVHRGLDNWSDANFPPPVCYDADGVERPGSRRHTHDCIVEALVTSYRVLGGGEIGDRARTITNNLTDAFEDLAIDAITHLYVIAVTTSHVR